MAIERLGKYTGRVTPAEMTAPESAMLVSLGLSAECPQMAGSQLVADLTARLTDAETRCEVFQQMYDRLLSRVVR